MISYDVSRKETRTMPQPIDPGHNETRSTLTGLGLILLIIGGIFTLIGLVDFFTAFGGMHPPTKFWCAFIGLPMVAIGMKLLFFGNMGRIARYMSEEVSPVGTDTFNYAAGQTRDGIRQVARAIGEGLNATASESAKSHACPQCGHQNDADAQFCSGCGKPLAISPVCPHCGTANNANARFCDQCGKTL
jgi:hypothetical protein